MRRPIERGRRTPEPYLDPASGTGDTEEEERALEDFLRGLILCVKYDLPKMMTDPPMVGLYHFVGNKTSPYYKKMVAEHQEQVEHRNKVMFERHMLRYRYSLTRVAKRISGDLHLSTNTIKEILVSRLKDQENSAKVIMLLESPNERPWK